MQPKLTNKICIKYIYVFPLNKRRMTVFFHTINCMGLYETGSTQYGSIIVDKCHDSFRTYFVAT